MMWILLSGLMMLCVASIVSDHMDAQKARDLVEAVKADDKRRIRIAARRLGWSERCGRTYARRVIERENQQHSYSHGSADTSRVRAP